MGPPKSVCVCMCLCVFVSVGARRHQDYVLNAEDETNMQARPYPTTAMPPTTKITKRRRPIGVTGKSSPYLQRAKKREATRRGNVRHHQIDRNQIAELRGTRAQGQAIAGIPDRRERDAAKVGALHRRPPLCQTEGNHGCPKAMRVPKGQSHKGRTNARTTSPQCRAHPQPPPCWALPFSAKTVQSHRSNPPRPPPHPLFLLSYRQGRRCRRG